MNVLARLGSLVIPLALLAACASAPPAEEGAPARQPSVSEQPAQPPAETAPGAESMGVPEARGFQGNPLEDPNSPLSKRVIYFDFDRADIKPEYRDLISAHAQYLSQNPNARMTLEGHADERGSREYNMGLGERRAQAVRALLTLQGASPQQIKTVSYGEERPVAFGHDEASWHLNRRVEIVYR